MISWILALGFTTFITYNTHYSFIQAPPQQFLHMDKLLHVGAFFVLGFLYLNVSSRQFNQMSWWRVAFALLAGFAYGAFDEYHQLFVEHRQMDLLDWVADCIGVLGGCVSGMIYYWSKPNNDSALD